MDKEEKELQIKLAKLNTKLQICIAAVFGFIALAGAFIVVGYQFGIDSLASSPEISPKFWVSMVFFVFSAIVLIVASNYIKKLNSCEKEIENLK